MRRVWGLLWVCMGLVASVSAQPAEPLRAAWVSRNGTLMLWNANTNAPQAATLPAPAFDARYAPTGARLAVTHGDGIPSGLSVLEGDTLTTIEVPLAAGQFIAQVAWADDTTLYFNTAQLTTLGVSPQSDLYRVVLPLARATLQLPAGAGGALLLSPTRTDLALVYAGKFDNGGNVEAQGELRLLALDDPSANPRTLFTFAPVQTASPVYYYPQVRWLPSSAGLLLSVLPADALYTGAAAALWQVPRVGEAALVGRIDADFFGAPSPAPNGEAWLYGQRVGETLAPRLADAAGGAVCEFAQAGVLWWAWADDGDAFVLLTERAAYVGRAALGCTLTEIAGVYDGAYWAGARALWLSGADAVRYVQLDAQMQPTQRLEIPRTGGIISRVTFSNGA